MNILLIKPCWPYPFGEKEVAYNRIWPPLSLVNCAALLEREGHRVEILDAHAERISPQDIVKHINLKEFDKIFVTSSSLDKWQCPNLDLNPFLDMMREIIKWSDDAYVVGYHGTVKPEEILQYTNAKAVVRGEPELTVLEICEGKTLSEIKGLTYKEDGQIVSTAPREPLDLGTLPIPAFHLLRHNRYFYEILGGNFTLFEGSRGCPYNCIYCSRIMQGRQIRRKPVAKLIQEIDLAVKDFGIKKGYFKDLEFTIDKGWVTDLCDLLIQRKYDFQWCCQTRPDEVDQALLLKMKQAGCRLIHYGVETGSERMMRLLRKGMVLEKAERGVLLTKKVGIKTLCFFIFGFPAETKKDVELTLSFVKRLNPTYVSFHIAVPYPGTELYEEIKDVSTEMIPEAYPLRCSYDNLQSVVRRSFIRFHLRPTYIISRLFQDDWWVTCKQFRLFLGYLYTNS